MHAKFACFGARAQSVENCVLATHWYTRPPHTPSVIHYDGMLADAIWLREEGMKQ